jgi:hypothetical protein
MQFEVRSARIPCQKFADGIVQTVLEAQRISGLPDRADNHWMAEPVTPNSPLTPAFPMNRSSDSHVRADMAVRAPAVQSSRPVTSPVFESRQD